MEEGDTLVNAAIGGAVTFVAGSFVPFAPILGGGVAGYVEGGDRMDGVKVGAYSGAIAYVPSLAITLLIVSFLGVAGLGFGLGLFGLDDAGLGAAGLLGAVVLFFVYLVASFAYFVGGGALGGWVGNYVKYDTDVDF